MPTPQERESSPGQDRVWDAKLMANDTRRSAGRFAQMMEGIEVGRVNVAALLAANARRVIGEVSG
jgi:hypothetical protein